VPLCYAQHVRVVGVDVLLVGKADRLIKLDLHKLNRDVAVMRGRFECRLQPKAFAFERGRERIANLPTERSRGNEVYIFGISILYIYTGRTRKYKRPTRTIQAGRGDCSR